MFYNACLKTILSIIYKNTIDSFTNEIILGADVKNGKEVKFKLALNLTSFKAGTSCTPEFVKVMSIYLRSLRSKRFQSSYSAKVRAFPLPPRSFFFFCSRPNFLDELAPKRLLCRLISTFILSHEKLLQH